MKKTKRKHKARARARRHGRRRRNRPGDALFRAENDVLFNPDDSIRALERAAASGEPGAVLHLAHALARAGVSRSDVKARLAVALRDPSVPLVERANFAPYVLDSRPYVHDVADVLAGYDPATHRYSIDSEQRWKISSRKNVAAALRKLIAKAGAKTKDVTISVPDYANASAVDFNVRTEKGAKVVRELIVAGLHGSSIYPSNREDRSEPQTDYFEPGGPRIATEWVGPFAMALLEAAGFVGKEADEAAAYGPAPQLQPGSVVRFRAKGAKGKKRWAVSQLRGDNKDQVELHAMGGSIKGSTYDRVPIADLVLDSDQSLNFEGPNARYLRNSFEGAVERGQQFDKFQAARRAAFKAGEAHAAERQAMAAAPATFVFSGPGGQTTEEEVFPIGMSNWAPPPPPPPAAGDDLFPVAPPSWAPPPPPPPARRNPFFAPEAIQYVAWAMNPANPLNAHEASELLYRGAVTQSEAPHTYNEREAAFLHGRASALSDVALDPDLVDNRTRDAAVADVRDRARLTGIGMAAEDVISGRKPDWYYESPAEDETMYDVQRRGELAAQANPMGKGPYPWDRKREQYAGMDSHSLQWAYADAIVARDNMQGWNTDAEVWYADDAHTIAAELGKRGLQPDPQFFYAVRRREAQKVEAGLAERRQREELASLRASPGAARVTGLDLDRRVPASASDWSGGEGRVRGLELENPHMDDDEIPHEDPGVSFRRDYAERLGLRHGSMRATLGYHPRYGPVGVIEVWREDPGYAPGWTPVPDAVFRSSAEAEYALRFFRDGRSQGWVEQWGRNNGEGSDFARGYQALVHYVGARTVRNNPGIRWDPKKGWVGLNSKTLYAITDPATGAVLIRPGYELGGVGPTAVIRVATRAEAEQHWQKPLHGDWAVTESATPGQPPNPACGRCHGTGSYKPRAIGHGAFGVPVGRTACPCTNVKQNPFFAPEAIQYVAFANPPQWTAESVAQQAKNKYGAQSPWGYFRLERSKGKAVRLTILGEGRPNEQYAGTAEAVADYLNKILMLAEQLQAQRGLTVSLAEIAKVVRDEGGFAK